MYNTFFVTMIIYSMKSCMINSVMIVEMNAVLFMLLNS